MTAAEHTLVRDGAAHVRRYSLNGYRARPLPIPESPGRAVCSCTWMSAFLPTTEARRQAHAQHVEEEQP